MKRRTTLKEYLRTTGIDPLKADLLIRGGRVYVDGVQVREARTALSPGAKVEVREEEGFVSRAAYKLLGALNHFHPQIEGRVCLDLGASHGGFTQLLLRRGAARVYALDVAYGILDYSLRSDPRVVPLERTNVRDLTAGLFDPEDLHRSEPLFVTCDLSFISLKSVFESVTRFATEEGLAIEGIFLLKPQFESSKTTEKGIQKDPEIRREIREGMRAHILSLGWRFLGEREADVRGSKGNQEYTLYVGFPKGERQSGEEGDSGKRDSGSG